MSHLRDEKGEMAATAKIFDLLLSAEREKRNTARESEEGTGLGRELRGISHFRKHIRGKKFVFIKM